MKKILLLSFLFSCLMCSAQDWRADGKWYHPTQAQFGPWTSYSTSTSEYIKDTVINNTNCSKVRFSCGCTGISYIYESNKQVFWMDPNSNQFNLLYDFNKVAGETFVAHIYNDSIEIIVDSVNYEWVSGKQIKAQYFHYGFNPNYYFLGTVIYEGIGSPDCFFPVYGALDGCGCGLKCFEDTVNGLYKFSSIPCDTSYSINNNVSVDELELLNKLTVEPSITDDFITVDSNQLINKISLIDIAGKEFFSQTVKEKNLVLSLKKYENGIYFLLISAGENFIVKKIVKTP